MSSVRERALHAVAVVAVVLSSGVSVARHRAWDAAREALARPPLDAAERMAARWEGSAEPEGAPLLPGFPTREAWDRCAGVDRRDRACTAVDTAARFWPPTDARAGRARAADDAAALVARVPPARRMLVISWFAGVDPAGSGLDVLRLRAAAEATLLGAPPGAGLGADALLAGLGPLREAAGAHGPGVSPRALPTYDHADFPASIDLGAEVIARAGGTGTDPVPPLGALAAGVRRGQAPDAGAWSVAGAAGVLALEAVRGGRADLVGPICAMVADPPSAADQLAGLYALAHLGLAARGCEAAGAWLAQMKVRG